MLQKGLQERQYPRLRRQHQTELYNQANDEGYNLTDYQKHSFYQTCSYLSQYQSVQSLESQKGEQKC